MVEKKGLLEIVLMPLVVAVVGALATYFVTKQQIRSADLLSRTQLRSAAEQSKAEQKVKILQIFGEKITSERPEDRELAIRILSTIDSELAVKISSAILQNEAEDVNVRKAAQEVRTNSVSDFLARLEGGSYAVVVASADNEHSAEAEVEKLKGKYPELFEPETDLDKRWGEGKYKDVQGRWAVYVGGLYSRRSAEELRRMVVLDLGLARDSFITKP